MSEQEIAAPINVIKSINIPKEANPEDSKAENIEVNAPNVIIKKE